MKMTADVSDVRDAVKRMNVNLIESQTVFPFITVLADEEGGAIFATDKLTFVESRFKAEVEEVGTCQIGKAFDSLLSNIRDDRVTLKTTEKMLSIQGSQGLKGRLQMIVSEAAPRDVVIEMMNNTLIDIDVTVLKADLVSLIQLCKLLPSTGSSVPWVTLEINEDSVVGSTPGSEIGGIEALPFQIIASNILVFPATIKIAVPRIEKFVGLCNNECNLQTAADPKVPLIIRDPHSPMWWAMSGRGA